MPPAGSRQVGRHPDRAAALVPGEVDGERRAPRPARSRRRCGRRSASRCRRPRRGRGRSLARSLALRTARRSARASAGVQAATGVPHLQHDVDAGAEALQPRRRRRVVEPLLPGDQLERAAVGHGFARVGAELGQHLLELVRIGHDRIEVRRRASRRPAPARPPAGGARERQPATSWLRSSTRGASTWRRLKASSWRVRLAARSAERWICARSSRAEVARGRAPPAAAPRAR